MCDSPSGQVALYPLRYHGYGNNFATGSTTVFDVAVRVRKLANERPVYEAPYMSRKQLHANFKQSCTTEIKRSHLGCSLKRPPCPISVGIPQTSHKPHNRDLGLFMGVLRAAH
jgi:hypothetical protein